MSLDKQRGSAKQGQLQGWHIAAGVLAILALIGGTFVLWRSTRSSSPEAGPVTPGTSAARGPVWFEDVTAASGVDFVHYDSATPMHYIHETIGSGVAWIDYDNDGWPDLFFVQAGPLLNAASSGSPPTHKMYHNNRDGTFTDVTKELGLDQSGFGLGVAVGDFDNDGFDDLVITYLGRIALFHNEADANGKRRFVDVTAKSGLVDTHFATSCAWGDIDGDGLLDLYVCNYVEADLKNYAPCALAGTGLRHTCSPIAFPAVAHQLFRNKGGGVFEDVSQSSGIASAPPAYGLGVVMADLDGDGWLDIFVANDMKPAYLFHNQGGGKFKEKAVVSGCGFGPNGATMSGMGVAVGDLDESGRPSLFVTNFQASPNVLFLNRGGLSFHDATYPSGLGAPSLNRLGFGTVAFDADLDGHIDVVVANGHVSRVAPEAFHAPFEQEAQFFGGTGQGKYQDLSHNAGPYFQTKVVGRGLAFADYDNDGRLDLAFNNCGGRAALLHNSSSTTNHWLRLELIGNHQVAGPKGRRSSRSAIGAWVEITTAGRKQTRFLEGGGSYLSASERRLYFGLGGSAQVDRAIVYWPSGTTQDCGPLLGDRGYRVEEGMPPVAVRPR
jgi:enediyne biosynthesis protein E4